jgi:peptidoglycan/xylan/chitin deacetylase (PgdA/CDA1 family)
VKEFANIVSLDDILAGRMSLRKINVAITFDDGYRGWLDNVCPVLRDIGLSATFSFHQALSG